MAVRHRPNWRYVTSNVTPTEDIRLDLTDVELADDTWDLIIVYHMLEHIADDQKAMREMHRIVRPGGRAIVQVPLELGLAGASRRPGSWSRRSTTPASWTPAWSRSTDSAASSTCPRTRDLAAARAAHATRDDAAVGAGPSFRRTL